MEKKYQNVVDSKKVKLLQDKNFNFVTSPRWKDYENWMANLSEEAKNVPLKNLGITGTHDSGTYQLYTDEIYNVDDFTGISPAIAGPIIKAFAVTQDANIYAQLMEGIRYIDLRFALDNEGRIRIVHTVFGNDVVEIFKQIKQFLDSHPEEVVIIDIQNINNLDEDRQKKLNFIIKDAIANHLAPKPEFSTFSTLNDFKAKNKNAILLYPGGKLADEEPLYHNRNTAIVSPWYNTNDINYLLQKVSEGIKTLPANRSYYYVTQMILTINSSEIVDLILNILKWLPIPIYGQIRFAQEFDKLVSTSGIYNLTSPHFGQIQKWLEDYKPNSASDIFPNIVILDYYSKQNIGTINSYNDVYK